MKFTLKDYQSDAVADVLVNLRKGRRFYHLEGDRSAFSLAATTGAGKTVAAAAVIEALFYGDDSFDFESDPSAVILWFSDDPSLNEQTRARLMQASDRIRSSDLVVVQNTFNAEKFAPGKVYFLNTSKLSKNSLLVRGYADDDANQLTGLGSSSRPDMRTYTIWDTIQNTIEDESLTLNLILDEAHRGMGAPTTAANEEKSTIVKRLINGHAGVSPIPVVWGISATVARFDAAMSGAKGRTILPGVLVDPARVQESGLLKDDILLDIPAEAGAFDTVLLKRATRKIIDSTNEWERYAKDQGDKEAVVPLLVLQSPNTPDPMMLKRALDTIHSEWPELPTGAVAHVFGDHVDKVFGQHVVPYIKPERVQEARHIRVLIAKDAISTGWDCPRAEVLMSFRPAKDETHITQLLGRMVRTPLARRISGNDRLNSVDCLLPYFDRKTATSVARTLMNTSDDKDIDGGSGGSGGGTGRRVLINPREMVPNPTLVEAVWTSFESLPSQSLPKRSAKPVKRLTALAQALAYDQLRDNAGKEAHSEMHKILDGSTAHYQPQVTKAVTDVETVEGETVKGRIGGSLGYSAFSEAADERVIEDAFRMAGRVFSPDVARTYADYLAGPDDPDGDEDGLANAHVKLAALALVPEIKADLDREADKITISWLAQHRVAIKGLSDERRSVYNELQTMSTEPQRVALGRPQVRSEETEDDEQNLLAKRPKHVLCDEDGNFPVGSLNDWEISVLDSELGQPGTVAWYRNPARASQDSLAVSYRDGKGEWAVMRPDFVFFTQSSTGNIKASIVDPHGTHLSDCLPKLRGLAGFAESFETEFHRIEAVAKVKDTLRVLDLTKESVRKAVREASDAGALYSGPHASDY